MHSQQRLEFGLHEIVCVSKVKIEGGGGGNIGNTLAHCRKTLDREICGGRLGGTYLSHHRHVGILLVQLRDEN